MKLPILLCNVPERGPFCQAVGEKFSFCNLDFSFMKNLFGKFAAVPNAFAPAAACHAIIHPPDVLLSKYSHNYCGIV